jgi:hypothetical protein
VKQLSGSASGVLDAAAEECARVLCALESYPRWYPSVVREAEVLEHGPEGRPARVRTVLAVTLGPFSKHLAFTLGVEVAWPREVTLSRVPFGAADRETFVLAWGVAPGPRTELSLRLDANLDVPRLVPTAGVGDRMAASLVRHAIAEIERH